MAKPNAEPNKALHDPAVAKKFADLGVVTTPRSPSNFASFVVKQAGSPASVLETADRPE